MFFKRLNGKCQITMRNIARILVRVLSFAPLIFIIGCSQEMRSRYTPKNMLIGAAIGFGVALIACIIGGGGKKKDD